MNDAINRLAAQLQLFNSIDPKMQVSTILTFLEIANASRAGHQIGMQELEKKIGFRSSAASRNVYYWAEGHSQMSGGYNFVSVTMNIMNRRKRDLNLTPKGLKFVRELLGSS